jgi:hypothetical protein
MQPDQLTPVEEEFLELLHRECEENGLAVGIFRVGVVMGGMEYHLAYDVFVSLRKKRLIRARKLRNQQGQPWAIKRGHHDNVRVQSTGDAEI